MNFKAFIDLVFRTKSMGGGAGGGAGGGKNYLMDIVKEFKNSFLGMFAAVEVANRAVSGIFAAIQKSYAVSNISKRFGVATEDIRRLGSVAEEVGAGDLDTVGRLIARVTRDSNQAQAGIEGMRTQFDKLGITINDLTKLKPDELLFRIADGLENLSPAERAGVMQRLFGNLTPNAQILLGHGGQFLREQVKGKGFVASEQADKAISSSKKTVSNAADEIGEWLTEIGGFLISFLAILKDVVAGVIEVIHNMLTFNGKGLWRALRGRFSQALREGGAIIEQVAPKGSDMEREAAKFQDAQDKYLKEIGRGDLARKSPPKDIFGEATGEAEQAYRNQAATGVSTLGAIGAGGNVGQIDWQKATYDATTSTNNLLEQILRKMPNPNGARPADPGVKGG